MKSSAALLTLAIMTLKFSAVIVGSFLLFACELGGATEHPQSSKVVSAVGEAARKPAYLKPGAGVYIASPGLIEMRNTESQIVKVTLRSIHKQGKLTLRIKGDEALSVQIKSPQILEFLLNQESEVQLTLDVSAQREGKYFIHLFAEVDSPLGLQHRAMALPVYIGDDEKIAELKKKPSTYPAIKSLPAQESITNL